MDRRTWDARHKFKLGEPQDFVPGDQVRLFALIDEITNQRRNNWLHIYHGVPDIARTLSESLFSFDDSDFVDDLSVPDGMIVRVGTEFDKTWEIRNTGCVLWKGRFLREDNPGASGLTPKDGVVPIPTTRPSELATITVRFRAAADPGTSISCWKMVDGAGRYLLPHKRALFCKVKIVY